MFEPEDQHITCPQCRNREVYFDREIGYYCMFCGRQISIEEIKVLIEQEVCQVTSEDGS